MEVRVLHASIITGTRAWGVCMNDTLHGPDTLGSAVVFSDTSSAALMTWASALL